MCRWQHSKYSEQQNFIGTMFLQAYNLLQEKEEVVKYHKHLKNKLTEVIDEEEISYPC